MQGQKQFMDKEVTRFRLCERVPAHNFYRRLAEFVEWRFLYEETKALYSHTGQPSLDPVVFFKLVLVGRLENLVCDRRLVEHCALRLNILYCLGYEVNEELPWRSTISRTQQLYPTQVVEHLFNHVFAQVAQGLEAGDMQAVVGQTGQGPRAELPVQPSRGHRLWRDQPYASRFCRQPRQCASSEEATQASTTQVMHGGPRLASTSACDSAVVAAKPTRGGESIREKNFTANQA